MATETLGTKVSRMETENRRLRAARKRVLAAYQRFLDKDDLDGLRDALTQLEAATEETENMAEIRAWQDIDPADAKSLDLATDLTITAPLNEEGERCPWPWEPQQLVGAPMGQYHCPYCGAMVIAGMPHIDYAEDAAVAASEGEAEEK